MSAKKSVLSRVIVYFFVVIAILLLLQVSENLYGQSTKTVSYTQFLQDVSSDNVSEVKLMDSDNSITYTDSKGKKNSFIPVGDMTATIGELTSKGVPVYGTQLVSPSGNSGMGLTIAISIIPVLILIAAMFWLARKNSGQLKDGIADMGKSKARRIDPEDITVTFDDVAGSDEDMQEIQEIVDFLKNAEQYAKVKAKIPKGILLSGPPGTGKTLVCKAIAKESGIPFYSSSGSEFEEMLVGTGASRIRNLFDDARSEKQAIIFIDEIDAVGGQRGGPLGNGSKEQTLNQLLVEMDGFGDGVADNIIIIGATNRIDNLDPALTRPGRFDRIVTLGLPDLEARKKIIKIHVSKIVSDVTDTVIEMLARGTPGFSGADLAKLVNEAAIFAARDKRDTVNATDLDRAKDKVMMGYESPKKMSAKEIKMTAFHEAGHAIIGHLMPEHDPVYKVSIIPRSKSLGVTMFLPDAESYSYSKRKLESMIATLLAGRAAEQLMFGKDSVTTGASNDLTRATGLGRSMVTKWGLSNVGLSAHDQDRRRDYSENTGNMIDKEVEVILQKNYDIAYNILEKNIDVLKIMADALVEHETIDQEQISEILKDRKHE